MLSREVSTILGAEVQAIAVITQIVNALDGVALGEESVTLLR